MQSPQSIDELLARVSLPDTVSRIENERPAFHAPMTDDRRLAYFLVDEGIDPVRLLDVLENGLNDAGFQMEYCEKNDFYFRGPLGNLHLHLDGSPEGISARFDLSGKPVEVTQTWHHIPAGRFVLTFAI